MSWGIVGIAVAGWMLALGLPLAFWAMARKSPTWRLPNRGNLIVGKSPVTAADLERLLGLFVEVAAEACHVSTARIEAIVGKVTIVFVHAPVYLDAFGRPVDGETLGKRAVACLVKPSDPLDAAEVLPHELMHIVLWSLTGDPGRSHGGGGDSWESIHTDAVNAVAVVAHKMRIKYTSL